METIYMKIFKYYEISLKSIKAVHDVLQSAAQNQIAKCIVLLYITIINGKTVFNYFCLQIDFLTEKESPT